jgi:protein gp37
VPAWQALGPAERTRCLLELPRDYHGSFNETNENIEWAKWSWNPVTGCEHNCVYCYARDLAMRHYAQGFVPTFLPGRLAAPRNAKLPKRATDAVGWRNVFVCSMADLFGKWVPQEWIDAVFREVVAAVDWNFLFLTKFPQKLAEQEWPKNAWVGTSVDRQYRVEIAEKAFRGVKAGVKWLSCEPLLEPLRFSSLEMFDWVVIGSQSASTGAPEFQPPWDWVESLFWQARQAGCKVFIKPNLKTQCREYPGQA